MSANFYTRLLVLGLLGLLAACTPSSAVDVTPSSPSQGVELSPTAESIVSPQPSPSSPDFDCGKVQEIPLQECQALVSLYTSTKGEAWADNTGWLMTQSPCSWYGVLCQQGHVVELQLYYNQLGGSLPGEIGNLTHLKSLYLDRNQLSGPIPAEIGNLADLELLRLGGNQFNSVPAELANLSYLSILELWGNQLSGEIPSGLGNLANLQLLNLSSNEFTGSVPAELEKLKDLTQMDLSHNQLSGPIPTTLGELVALNELKLSNNQLTGSVPEGLSSLKNLYWLDLSYNQLSDKVPVALQSAPIGDLRLWGNQLEGTIPASQEELTPVDYEGVHFKFSSKLAKSIWPESVVAQSPSDQIPFWEIRPEYLRFTLAHFLTPDPFQSNGVGPSGHPQILIYPADEYREMSELAKAEIEALQTILATESTVPANPLPFLPLINASQVFHAQETYLDFQNGRGIRYITHYSQDIVGRLINQNIFYTFQGLTEDGKYYVVALFPLSAEGLGTEPVFEDWQAAKAHQNEDIQHLQSLSSSEFEPDLDILDQVIQSLSVETK